MMYSVFSSLWNDCRNLRYLLTLLVLLVCSLTACIAYAEDETSYSEPLEFDFSSGEWDGHQVILDDPAYFVFEEEEDAWPEYPIITSVGKTNVRVHGIQSNNPLLEYTVPICHLENDPSFAALMIEAEKYIGFPYVYGASNPEEGFDCSGFVCWVFIHSGVYDTGRRGATGLYSLCTEVSAGDARPGDLVFFEGTMGAGVDGITHVGIYVGDGRMIHAGDPVGFADLSQEKWQKHFSCFGRLPI